MAWPQGLPPGDLRHSRELPTANRSELAGSQLSGFSLWPPILANQSTELCWTEAIVAEELGAGCIHLLSLGNLVGLVINVLVCVLVCACVYTCVCVYTCACVCMCDVVCVCVYTCVH